MNSLNRIESLLQKLLDEWKLQREEARKAAARDPLLDAATTMFMLRVGERTLFNYVSRGKLISEKRGKANFYRESSVIALMNKGKKPPVV